MKNTGKFSLILMIFGFLSCQNNDASLRKVEFYVRGNCGMCEDRIEATVQGVNGVKEADYNVETKMLSVKFDSTATSEIKLHEAVAATGHETKEVAMNEKAHEELPDCCKKGFEH